MPYRSKLCTAKDKISQLNKKYSLKNDVKTDIASYNPSTNTNDNSSSKCEEITSNFLTSKMKRDESKIERLNEVILFQNSLIDKNINLPKTEESSSIMSTSIEDLVSKFSNKYSSNTSPHSNRSTDLEEIYFVSNSSYNYTFPQSIDLKKETSNQNIIDDIKFILDEHAESPNGIDNMSKVTKKKEINDKKDSDNRPADNSSMDEISSVFEKCSTDSHFNSSSTHSDLNKADQSKFDLTEKGDLGVISTQRDINNSKVKLKLEENKDTLVSQPQKSLTNNDSIDTNNRNETEKFKDECKLLTNTTKSSTKLKKHKECINLEPGILVEKLANKKTPTQHKKVLEPDINVKTSTKRPILYSCKLISLTPREVLKTEVQETPALSNLFILEDLLGYKRISGKSCCDEVIRKTLKTQIQLTRYFIESHHEMYLRCCQVVKTLTK